MNSGPGWQRNASDVITVTPVSAAMPGAAIFALKRAAPRLWNACAALGLLQNNYQESVRNPLKLTRY